MGPCYNDVVITSGVEEDHYQISHHQLTAKYPLGEEMLLADFRILYLDILLQLKVY
jgi:hypothetical protein